MTRKGSPHLGPRGMENRVLYKLFPEVRVSLGLRIGVGVLVLVGGT